MLVQCEQAVRPCLLFLGCACLEQEAVNWYFATLLSWIASTFLDLVLFIMPWCLEVEAHVSPYQQGILLKIKSWKSAWWEHRILSEPAAKLLNAAITQHLLGARAILMKDTDLSQNFSLEGAAMFCQSDLSHGSTIQHHFVSSSEFPNSIKTLKWRSKGPHFWEIMVRLSSQLRKTLFLCFNWASTL